MLRLTPVALTALALAVLVVSVAVPTVTAEEKTVEVTVDCGSDGTGPGAVTVNPWRLWLKKGDVASWNLGGGESLSDKTIIVEPKRDQRWPYQKRQHVSAQGKAEASGMTTDPYGDFTYNITFYCNGEAFVIDPRVRVGP